MATNCKVLLVHVYAIFETVESFGVALMVCTTDFGKERRWSGIFYLFRDVSSTLICQWLDAEAFSRPSKKSIKTPKN